LSAIFTSRKTSNFPDLCTISCFRRDVDEICDLLGYYAAYSGYSVSTFRDNIVHQQGSRFWGFIDCWRWDQ